MSKHRRKPARRHAQPADAAHDRPSCADAAPAAAVSEVPVEAPAPARSRPWKWVPGLSAASALLASLALYAWTLDFPMVFDDYTYLVDNPVFRDPGKFSYLLQFKEFVLRPASIGVDPDYAVNFVLRPVAYATFAINEALDGFTPRWFRAVNIVIHGFNSALVCALFGTLLRGSSLRIGEGSRLFIPAVAALIFAVHPLAIESVTYIIQRFTSLATLFVLLSLWLHFSSLKPGRRGWAAFLLEAAAVISMLLAMQTKECSFAAPFMAVLLDWLLLGTAFFKALRRSVFLLALSPIIPMLVLLTSSIMNNGQFDLRESFNIVNSRDAPLDHLHYIATQLTVVMHYIRLMFWPFGLNLDPEWPRYQSLLQAPVMAAQAGILALLASTGWWMRRHRDEARPALVFVCVVWYFATISISSGLVPLPDMVAEHRSYLPSIGIFVIFACLLDLARCHLPALRPWTRAVAPAAVALVLGLLSWRTCQRNLVWSTDESLWKDTAAKSPGKFRTWGNLGVAYSSAGKEEKAVECFRTALKIEPNFQNGIFNLSNSLLRLNRPQESLEVTLKLIDLDQNNARKLPVAYTLGLGLTGVGRHDEALEIFKNMLAVNPKDAQVLKAAGLVYYRKGLAHLALDHLRQSAAIQPDDKQTLALIEHAKALIPGGQTLRLR
ncbi:MAG: hypothetical protein CJBNEKGG_01134 [Prosthecobacter sp.]|nr:hypothetical protein [Prosthecobacter sp.]